MHKLIISTLALGAMTSAAAFAAEPLTPVSAQPLKLSAAQLDQVTAARRWSRGIDVDVNVALVKHNRQKNEAYQYADVYLDDIKGNCGSCSIFVGGNNEAYQSNEIEVDF
jgi:hypothetical protein